MNTKQDHVSGTDGGTAVQNKPYGLKEAVASKSFLSILVAVMATIMVTIYESVTNKTFDISETAHETGTWEWKIWDYCVFATNLIHRHETNAGVITATYTDIMTLTYNALNVVRILVSNGHIKTISSIKIRAIATEMAAIPFPGTWTHRIHRLVAHLNYLAIMLERDTATELAVAKALTTIFVTEIPTIIHEHLEMVHPAAFISVPVSMLHTTTHLAEICHEEGAIIG